MLRKLFLNSVVTYLLTYFSANTAVESGVV